jgi:hypothetical protein
MTYGKPRADTLLLVFTAALVVYLVVTRAAKAAVARGQFWEDDAFFKLGISRLDEYLQ